MCRLRRLVTSSSQFRIRLEIQEEMQISLRWVEGISLHQVEGTSRRQPKPKHTSRRHPIRIILLPVVLILLVDTRAQLGPAMCHTPHRTVSHLLLLLEVVVEVVVAISLPWAQVLLTSHRRRRLLLLRRIHHPFRML